MIYSRELLSKYGCGVRRTSQFVAVRGTRENSQPSREGLSDERRMYWSVRMMVSPPKSHQRLCMSESRYGWSRVRVCSYVGARWCRRLTGSRLCVRSYVPVSIHSLHSAREHRRTEMALISGSSLSPRLLTPVRLPASKHRLAHGLVNNMVARRLQSSEASRGVELLIAERLPFRDYGRAQRMYKADAPAIDSGRNKQRAERKRGWVGSAKVGK